MVVGIILTELEVGLGGAIELPWILLIRAAALQSRRLPTALNYLGIGVSSSVDY